MTTLMNWRGLAVLTLLCVLPRLSATVLTVTQTASGTQSASDNIAAQVYVGLAFAPFDPALGTLTQVAITHSIHIQAAASEFNPLPSPVTWLPAVSGSVRTLAVRSGELLSLLTDSFAATAGASVVLDSMESNRFSGQFDRTLSEVIVSPNALANFIGGSAIPFSIDSRLDHVVSYGQLSQTLTVSTKIEYRYSVTDGGATALLWSVALVMLAFAHRARGSVTCRR